MFKVVFYQDDKPLATVPLPHVDDYFKGNQHYGVISVRIGGQVVTMSAMVTYAEKEED